LKKTGSDLFLLSSFGYVSVSRSAFVVSLICPQAFTKKILQSLLELNRMNVPLLWQIFFPPIQKDPSIQEFEVNMKDSAGAFLNSRVMGKFTPDLLSNVTRTSRLSDQINIAPTSSMEETREQEWPFSGISWEKSGSM
jgi:hypothetical protein